MPKYTVTLTYDAGEEKNLDDAVSMFIEELQEGGNFAHMKLEARSDDTGEKYMIEGAELEKRYYPSRIR